MRWGPAFLEFLKRLVQGDPVALGIAGFFLVVGLLAGLIVLKVRRDLRRDDEAHAIRKGRKLPK